MSVDPVRHDYTVEDTLCLIITSALGKECSFLIMQSLAMLCVHIVYIYLHMCACIRVSVYVYIYAYVCIYVWVR